MLHKINACNLNAKDIKNKEFFISLSKVVIIVRKEKKKKERNTLFLEHVIRPQ